MQPCEQDRLECSMLFVTNLTALTADWCVMQRTVIEARVSSCCLRVEEVNWNKWNTNVGKINEEPGWDCSQGSTAEAPLHWKKRGADLKTQTHTFHFTKKALQGFFPHWLYKCCFFHREELERLFKRGYQALADTSVHRNVSSEQHTGVKRQLSFTQPAQRDRLALRHSYLGTVAVFTMHQLSKQFNCQLFVVAACLTDTLVSAWFEISHLRGNMLSKTMIDTSNIWLFECQID